MVVACFGRSKRMWQVVVVIVKSGYNSPMQKHTPKSVPVAAWWLLGAMFLIVAGIVLVRQWHHIYAGVQLLQMVDVVRAAPLIMATFVLASLSYWVLAYKTVPFGELLLIEWAAAAVNRVVPGGVGTIGVHAAYFLRRGLTLPQTVATISVNNLSGMLTHGAMLTGIILLTPLTSPVQVPSIPSLWVVVAVPACAVVGICAGRYVPVRKRVKQFLRNVGRSVYRYHHQPQKIMYSAAVLCFLTVVNVFTLHVLAVSHGVVLPAYVVFVVYTVGVMFGSAVPTPGGLAGVEAGLAGGFILYGVPAATAVTITLAFRLLTYWLPIIPGACALYMVRRRKLL